jgi:hypothetical protein
MKLVQVSYELSEYSNTKKVERSQLKPPLLKASSPLPPSAPPQGSQGNPHQLLLNSNIYRWHMKAEFSLPTRQHVAEFSSFFRQHLWYSRQFEQHLSTYNVFCLTSS